MKRALPAMLFLAIFLFISSSASALEAGNDWQPLVVARFGNIEVIDAEDGPLAAFLRGIRNDGRFPPPLKSLVGPVIRNPTFYGLVFEAWMEAVILAPNRPGDVQTLWIFPVDSRDEYMTQLSNQGLTEYEGMDGVTVLREMDEDGDFYTWYLEWLPGNLAVFGTHGDAVAACRRIYAENSAAHGLLAGADGEYMQPDVIVSLVPGAITSWQNSQPGQYWWRSALETLTRDLIAFWQPSPARVRLMHALMENLAIWPRQFERVSCSLWLEEDGIEWRLGVSGAGAEPTLSQLPLFRTLPERTALAYGVPFTPGRLAEIGNKAAALLIGGAGGVVTADARRAGASLFSLIEQGELVEMVAAWIPPLPGSPELGGARLVVTEWRRPDMLDVAWSRFVADVQPGSPVSQALLQLGWSVDIVPDQQVESAAEVRIFPADDTERARPYYNSALVIRRNGGRVALVVGESRQDAGARAALLAYRAELAREVVFSQGDGEQAVRQAFVRMPPRGASMIGLLDPVRFIQLALIESADWRPRSPDQHEPLSTQLAREMLSYGSMGAWTMVGEREPLGWHCSGGISWKSLARLAGALGITESIGME